MSIYRCCRNLILCVAFGIGIVNVCGAKSAFTENGWDELPAEELAATEPKVDPDAAVEYLYREMKVDDNSSHPTMFRHHKRLKIFSDAGVEDLDKIDIEYITGQRVSSIKARIIYPDHTIAHVSRKDIYKREILKDGKFKCYARSFSFPGLKKGCIIEYKFVITSRYWSWSLTYEVLDKYPTWKVHFGMRPDGRYAWYATWYRGQFSPDQKGNKFTLDITNVPAQSDKPFIPARKDFEPWIHFLYARDKKYFVQDEYWSFRGGDIVEANKAWVKPKQKEVKELAKTLFAGLSTQEEKLKAAYDYCSNEIENISGYTPKYTEEEIEELDDNKFPKHTIRRGYGTRKDINALFASLAWAAGYEASLALLENQEELRYDPRILSEFNLSDYAVAVKKSDGSDWGYYDPGSSFLPFGMLNPENTGSVSQLVFKQKRKDYYTILKTPSVKDEFTKSERKAEVTIDELGDLKGTITETYVGFASLWRKRLFASKTMEECKDYILEEEWQNRIPRASIKEIELQNHDNRENNLTIKYEISIPGYADILGDRVVLVPNVFEKGRKLVFEDEDRPERVCFPYGELYVDRVDFELPDSYELEGESLKPVDFQGALLVRRSINQVTSDNQSLIHQRIYFLKKPTMRNVSYGWVRDEFNAVQQADIKEAILLKSAGNEEPTAETDQDT